MKVSISFEVDPKSIDMTRLAEVLGFPHAPKPDSVARARKQLGGRAPSGSRLREAEYRQPLLEALGEMGGSGTRQAVTEAVYPKIEQKLTDVDRGRNPSGGIRWKNRVAWVRAHLVEEGFLKKGSPRGVWELTAKGWKEVLKRRPDLAA